MLLCLRNNVLRFRLILNIYIISLLAFFSLSFHNVQYDDTLLKSETELTTFSNEILSPANIENNLREYDGHVTAKLARNILFLQQEFLISDLNDLSDITFQQQIIKDFEKSRFLQFLSSHTGLRSPPSFS